MYHHQTLHDSQLTGVVNTVSEHNEEASAGCLLPLMKIKSSGRNLTVLWDSGASISLITFERARELKVKGLTCPLLKLVAKLKEHLQYYTHYRWLTTEMW